MILNVKNVINDANIEYVYFPYKPQPHCVSDIVCGDDQNILIWFPKCLTTQEQTTAFGDLASWIWKCIPNIPEIILFYNNKVQIECH